MWLLIRERHMFYSVGVAWMRKKIFSKKSIQKRMDLFANLRSLSMSSSLTHKLTAVAGSAIKFTKSVTLTILKTSVATKKFL